MYLSRLNVKGFKSYTEPAEVDFNSEIAIIIGSGGVGKSSALNAIVRGLGDDDSANLRCGSPRDLVFADAGLAPPEESAQVVLIFEEDGREFSFCNFITKLVLCPSNS
jgi:chromosome segregation protein